MPFGNAPSDGNGPPKGYQELPSGEGKRWERVTVPEEMRMKLNGESREQMQHVLAIKAAGGVSLPDHLGPDVTEDVRTDTSVDQEWPIDDSPSALRADKYVLVTTIIWLVPKLLLFAIPMVVFTFLPMSIVRLYMSVLPDGTERVNRSWPFYWIVLVTYIIAIPVVVLASLSLILDNIAYYFFSLIYCACTWRWKQAMDGIKLTRPFNNGPRSWVHLNDFFVALIGQTSRQMIGETTWSVGCMFLLMPWLKYYINCNPWIYNLGYRMCQQISTEMADLGGVERVADTARYIISCTREDRNTAERIDIWSFVPHYPFPPPDRRWALGLQAGGSRYPGKFTLIVHTTHAIQNVRGCTEQFVLSNSCELPIYRVMLWYNNPYHFLTGWVEASVSNGKPSQPNKDKGGEHPMWLLTGRTPMVAGRDSFTGSGMIDAFFDYWLPVFVHEMRTQVLGRETADLKYQEVKSADGLSAPMSFFGTDAYKKAKLRTALSDYKLTAKEEMADVLQPAGRRIAGLAGTKVGMRIAQCLQGPDVHAEDGPLEGWSSLTHTVRPAKKRQDGSKEAAGAC